MRGQWPGLQRECRTAPVTLSLSVPRLPPHVSPPEFCDTPFSPPTPLAPPPQCLVSPCGRFLRTERARRVSELSLSAPTLWALPCIPRHLKYLHGGLQFCISSPDTTSEHQVHIAQLPLKSPGSRKNALKKSLLFPPRSGPTEAPSRPNGQAKILHVTFGTSSPSPSTLRPPPSPADSPSTACVLSGVCSPPRCPACGTCRADAGVTFAPLVRSPDLPQ